MVTAEGGLAQEGGFGSHRHGGGIWQGADRQAPYEVRAVSGAICEKPGRSFLIIRILNYV